MLCTLHDVALRSVLVTDKTRASSLPEGRNKACGALRKLGRLLPLLELLGGLGRCCGVLVAVSTGTENYVNEHANIVLLVRGMTAERKCIRFRG